MFDVIAHPEFWPRDALQHRVRDLFAVLLFKGQRRRLNLIFDRSEVSPPVLSSTTATLARFTSRSTSREPITTASCHEDGLSFQNVILGFPNACRLASRRCLLAEGVESPCRSLVWSFPPWQLLRRSCPHFSHAPPMNGDARQIRRKRTDGKRKACFHRDSERLISSQLYQGRLREFGVAACVDREGTREGFIGAGSR